MLARQAFEAYYALPSRVLKWEDLSSHERAKWLCCALTVAATLGVESLVEMTPPCRVDTRLRPEAPFPRNFIDSAAKRIAEWLS